MITRRTKRSKSKVVIAADEMNCVGRWAGETH
jgi:hypothetical protein